jgi:hypothetical protein
MTDPNKMRDALWQKLSKAVPGHVAPMRGSKEWFDIGFNQGWKAASEAQGEVNEYLAQNMLMAFIDGREGRQVTNYAGSQRDEDGMRNVIAFLIQHGHLRTPPAASKEEK